MKTITAGVIAKYDQLRAAGIPKHQAVRQAGGGRYPVFQAAYKRIKGTQIDKIGKKVERLSITQIKLALKQLRKTPLIKRYIPDVGLIPTNKTYTCGAYKYSLYVKAAFRNEKTREVVINDRTTYATETKDFDTAYQNATHNVGNRPESNWIVIDNPNDPDYYPMVIRWHRWGGRYGGKCNKK